MGTRSSSRGGLWEQGPAWELVLAVYSSSTKWQEGFHLEQEAEGVEGCQVTGWCQTWVEGHETVHKRMQMQCARSTQCGLTGAERWWLCFERHDCQAQEHKGRRPWRRP